MKIRQAGIASVCSISMHGVIRHDNIFRKDLTLAGRDLIKVCVCALMASAARGNLHNSSHIQWRGSLFYSAVLFRLAAGCEFGWMREAQNPHCRGYLNSYRPARAK